MNTLVIFTRFAAMAVLSSLVFTACNNQPSASRFINVPIHVTDSTTLQPIVGATVSQYCMGGTPYGTNLYHTDVNGVANVMFYERSPVIGVRIELDGYETLYVALPATNPVVRLRRVRQ